METSGAAAPSPDSPLSFFLTSLAEDGRAPVLRPPLSENQPGAADALARLDAQRRREVALDLPAFSPAVALWAARLGYQICRFIACRDLGENEIAAACEVRCPGPRTPESDWSADLTLRHLPRIFRLASHGSNADPLVDRVKRIAAAWPLSSVGVPAGEAPVLDSFIGHRALRRLYADRIVAAGDTSRLGDPRVDGQLRADLGAHRDLAPAIAARLFPERTP